MQDISIAHTDFSYINSKLYDLSISFRRDGFSFSVWNSDSGNLMSVYFKTISDSCSEEEYNLECTKFLQHEAFSYSYSKTSIVYVTEKVTLIPAALYNTDDLEAYFSLNHTLRGNEIIETYKVKNAESVIVYALSKRLKNDCIDKFGAQVLFFPQTAPLLESSILENKLVESKTVFVSLESTFFDVIILEGQKVVMCNSYDFTNVNDYVYYLMNVYEQLGLNTLKDKVVLSGRISRTSSYYDATKMFIKNTEIKVPLPTQQNILQTPFNQISFPLFSQLINLRLCE